MILLEFALLNCEYLLKFITQLQVAARRSSISEYYDYRDQLLADNISIIASIQHIEDQTV